MRGPTAAGWVLSRVEGVAGVGTRSSGRAQDSCVVLQRPCAPPGVRSCYHFTMHRLSLALLLLSLLAGCLGSDDDDDSTEAPVLCADFDGCDVNAGCTDTADGPVCDCNDGWEGDGTTCDDVDECAIDNGGCDDNATCTNTEGDRDCDCNKGYEGDGLTCEELVPYWELVDTLTLVWAPVWAPETVVIYDDTIVWGDSMADGLDSRLHQYDVGTGTYAEIAGGTEELCACGLTEAAAMLGSELYLFGNWAQFIDLANLAAGWQSATIPDERRVGEAGAISFGGQVYTFGGRGPLDTTQSYSGGPTGSWSDHAPVPYALDYGRPVEYGGSIYLLGGVNDSASNSRASVYDPLNDTWSVLPNPPTDQGRTRGAGVFGDQIYMYHQDRRVHFYDPVGSAWTLSLDGPELQQPSVVTIGGAIYAIGGGLAGPTEVHRLVWP